MKNIFKNSLLKMWLKKNLKNLIQVETKYGKLYLLKNDEFISGAFLRGKYWAEYEIKIFEDLLNFKNSKELVFFDVGANVGSHALGLSKIFKDRIKIYCFEAQSYVHKILEANIYENHLRNVLAFNNAVSNNNELIQIKVPDYSQINNFGSLELKPPKYSDNNKIFFSNSIENIGSIKLDDLKDIKVDFIKIDVEGMEHLVIEGGKELINKHRPFLFIELVKTETKDIFELFKKIKYSAYLINNENGLFIPSELKVPIRNLKKIYD